MTKLFKVSELIVILFLADIIESLFNKFFELILISFPAKIFPWFVVALLINLSFKAAFGISALWVLRIIPGSSPKFSSILSLYLEKSREGFLSFNILLETSWYLSLCLGLASSFALCLEFWSLPILGPPRSLFQPLISLDVK